MTAPPVLLLHVGSSLPDVELELRDATTGSLLDLSSVSAWRLRFVQVGSTDVVVEKTAGFTGSATAPNVRITWQAGDLDPLVEGRRYHAQLRMTISGKHQYVDLLCETRRTL